MGVSLGLRLESWILNSIFLTKTQKSIIIGLMLGDGHIRRASTNGNPYIFISFFSASPAYASVRYPLLVQRRDGSFYLQMNTRCLACLISIYDLFIVNGVKTIPANICYYLTPLALALWSMDDG